MKNIAFSKNGKSIKFTHKGNTGGGDGEPPSLLRLLANNNPDTTFYIVGRSDFSRLTPFEKSELFDYDNVVDVWEKVPKGANCTSVVTDWVKEYFKNTKVKIDAHIHMTGQIGTVTIPGKIRQLKEPELFASVIDMTSNYSSPINVWQNDNLDIPVIEICNDPRYTIAQARDIMFIPKECLSQYNDEYIHRHIRSYADQSLIYTPIKTKYAEMQNIFLYDRPLPKIDIIKKTVGFAVVLNEGKPSRYPMLDKWVLQNNPDVSIYGQWDEKYTEKDSRFKGSLSSDKLHSLMSTVRSSFAIPIAPGWVTSKYVELIWMGVVPFVHPTYDTQNHLKLPDHLRPETPEQLQKQIELLSDDKLYLEIITELRDRYCKPEYLDGTRLNQIVMNSVYSDYVQPNRVEKQNTVDSLEDFF